MADMEGFTRERLSQLTQDQLTTLTKFRAKVCNFPGQPDTTDLYYLIWLRAREYNLDKAVEMYRNHLKFRQEVGADTVLDWTPPEVLRKYYPGGYFGEDRDGHPVWYENLGNMDVRGLHRAVKAEDVIRYEVQRAEIMTRVFEEYTLKKGKYIDTVTVIVDCEFLSLQRHYYWPGIQMVREIFSLFEANYPERTRRVFVVKAPKVFPFTYSLVKVFLSESTKDKIIVLGRNWQRELQKYIAPDQIPEAYGGTRCEPDPWCTDHVNPGYDVPQECYLTNQTETTREDMDRIMVGRGGNFELECSIHLPGSALRWEFVSTEHDIAFGCFFQSPGSNRKRKEIVIPMQRRNSHVVPENGVHTCDKTGIYVLKFDNSYSWTKPKEVFYSVKVLPPESEQEDPSTCTPAGLPSQLPGPLSHGKSATDLLPDTESDSSSDEFFDCYDYFPCVQERPQMRTTRILLNSIQSTV